jgi:hypothetical protein
VVALERFEVLTYLDRARIELHLLTLQPLDLRIDAPDRLATHTLRAALAAKTVAREAGFPVGALQSW